MRTVLSLFSGIAGLCELGIVEAGLSNHFQVTQFVERNPYCQRVLRKHFPDVPIHDDIKTFAAEPRQFDCVVAGFPCQDISGAGKQAGIKEGTRSGLFFELVRIVRVVRPQFIILENVANLLANGMGIVLRELSEARYDAEWSIVSCAEVGGVHLRERVFIIAYPTTHPKSSRWSTSRCKGAQRGANIAFVNCCTKAANTNRAGLEGTRLRGAVANSVSSNSEETQSRICGGAYGYTAKVDGGSHLMNQASLSYWLPHATDASKIPHRRERLEALGNAVVPAQAAIAWQRVACLAGLLAFDA